MNLEGKCCGYNKKTLAIIALVVLVAGVMFYAGAKYEKRKLTSLGLLKTSTTKKKVTNPAGDATTQTETTATTPSGNANTTNTPTDPKATVPASTTKPTTPITTPNNLQK